MSFPTVLSMNCRSTVNEIDELQSQLLKSKLRNSWNAAMDSRAAEASRSPTGPEARRCDKPSHLDFEEWRLVEVSFMRDARFRWTKVFVL
ncbi:unnamed protein product [Soboliphyme baturini]|uniref:Uncharacterized protein n=1 Tax=Soboliphyme baturini TaxID=241478 RepID=A0A183ITJ8_9BILA|nr:unnamed protein product [Soboliphyme baturini]